MTGAHLRVKLRNDRRRAASDADDAYDGGMVPIRTDSERLRAVCERYGVARLEVFGSLSRGEAAPDSDVDLLYELKPDVRLGFRFFDLEDELAEVFGRPVDLVAKDSINKHIRSQILRDAQPFYAA